MQQLLAWSRQKVVLCVAAVLILGTFLLIWSGGSDGLASTAVENPPALEDSVEPDLSVTPSEGEQAPGQAQKPEVTPSPALVVVHVTGAVRSPDAYTLPAAARVKDAVLAAGGFTPDADAEQINLAEHIADAQQIRVPRQGELPPAAPAEQGGTPVADEETPLNINTASAADLESLDGIGKVIAERIVEYRTANGPFQSVEDLQKVKGISARIFAAIAPYITIGP